MLHHSQNRQSRFYAALAACKSAWTCSYGIMLPNPPEYIRRAGRKIHILRPFYTVYHTPKQGGRGPRAKNKKNFFDPWKKRRRNHRERKRIWKTIKYWNTGFPRQEGGSRFMAWPMCPTGPGGWCRSPTAWPSTWAAIGSSWISWRKMGTSPLAATTWATGKPPAPKKNWGILPRKRGLTCW